MIEKIVWLADGTGFLMNAAEANSSLLQIWQVNLQEYAEKITRDPSHYVGLSATKNSQAVLTIKNERTSAVWIYAPAANSLIQMASSRYLGATESPGRQTHGSPWLRTSMAISRFGRWTRTEVTAIR